VGRRDNVRTATALGALAALLGGCGPGEPEAPPVSASSAPRAAAPPPADQNASLDDTAVAVARVDGNAIRLDEARALLRDEEASDPARRRAAVEGVITRRLAAAEARRRGLDAEPTLHAELAAVDRDARARREALLRDALYARIREELVLSEAELRAHYARIRSRFLERQVRLRRRSFPDRAAAEAADAALGPEGRLDPRASETLGPAPVRALPPEVLPEALGLEAVGDRVVVDAAEGTAVLVELVEVLPAEAPPPEAVRERVEASLRTLRAQEAMRELLAERRAAASVEIDEGVLADEEAWRAGSSQTLPPRTERGRARR